MNIEKTRTGSHSSLALLGRLDAYWAPHLSNEIEQSIRDGADEITVDLQQVDFLSSAGIGILLKYFKLLSSIKGTLRVVNPSDAVLSVLELSGLTALLLNPRDAAPQQRRVAPTDNVGALERDGVLYSIYPHDPQPAMTVALIGDPSALADRRYGPNDQSSAQFGVHSLAFGVGAFGASFEECRNQFGEFLSVGGTSVVLPSNGTNVPDFQTARGTYIPKVNVLYGVHCNGTPSRFLRFESTDAHAGIPLSRLAAGWFDTMDKADMLAYVMVAVTSGLIGASLRRSPAEEEEGSMFAHPHIRRWLTFTSEPAYRKTLVLTVGIVSREQALLDGFLHPLDEALHLRGHAHAIACPFRHLQTGKLDLVPTVSALFENETPLGMLHLVRDQRPLSGRGESEFIRGVVWLGALV
jgi:anti-sigma B factor antagonist